MYIVCTSFIQCSYSVRTVFVQRMFRNEFVHTSFIFFRTISKLSVLSTYFVHQYTRLKASQQHIPNQSKHSFQSSRFRFCTPALCRRGCWLRPADRQAARPRWPRWPCWPSPQRDRAGRAGLRRSATALAALASAAALDPAAEPKERRNDFPNSLDNPSCSDGSVVVKNVLW